MSKITAGPRVRPDPLGVQYQLGCTSSEGSSSTKAQLIGHATRRIGVPKMDVFAPSW